LGESTNRRRFLTIIKILVGFTLLILSLRGVEWGQFSVSIKSVSPIWLLGLLVSMVVGLLLKVVRWGILMRKFGLNVSGRRLTEAFFLGQVVNILLPTRGGDLVRLGWVSAQEPAILPQATATLALEKFIDLLALAFLALGVAAYLPPEASQWLRGGLLPVSVLALVGLSLIIFLGPVLWDKMKPLFSHFTHPWLTRGVELIDKFVISSLWLRKVSNLLPLLGITGLIWVFMLLNSLILFRALTLRIPLTAAGLVLVLGYIRTVLQMPPGSVGPFYFFAQLGVTTFGASSEAALAFAILLHALVILTPIITSAVLLLTSPDAIGLLRLIRRSND
jgi:glycosyltransferase 2 family protein